MESGKTTSLCGIPSLHDLHDFAALAEPQMLGFIYNSSVDAENFFRSYAALNGFSIRKQDSRRDVSGVYVMHKWVCCRAGRPRKATGVTIRYRPSGRIGCATYLRIVREKSGGWYVAGVKLEHNHELVQTELTSFMKENRHLARSDVTLEESMLNVGFRQCEIFRWLAQVAGGIAKVGFIEKDLNNEIGCRRRKQQRLCSDVDAAIAYLMSKRRDDTGMALVTHVEDGMATRLYWADSQNRIDFHYFGDVVAFDSTFKTNAYGMQMVVIVGVNHHHQTIVLASGLLRTETTEDYKWFLRTHNSVMGGKHPASVVTDADKSIIAAVREVWQKTKHRLCLWHLQRNIACRVPDRSRRKTLSDIMHSNRNCGDVEKMWKVWCKENGGTVSSVWMEEMYRNREMWWKCYLKGHFWGEMRSTQRCEGMHGYMKGYLRSSHRLHEYLHHYERAVANLRHKELRAEYSSATRVPPLLSVMHVLEDWARQIYTMQSFRRIQRQLKREALFYVAQTSGGSSCRVYRLKKYLSEENKAERIIEVYSCVGNIELSCSCLHYETVGFPCAHVFHICKVEGRTVIPRNLVRERWTREGKSGRLGCADVKAYGITMEDTRRGALQSACQQMCLFGSLSLDVYHEMAKEIEELTDKYARKAIQNGRDEKVQDRQGVTRKRRKLLAIKPVIEYGEFASPTKPADINTQWKNSPYKSEPSHTELQGDVSSE